MRKLVFVFRVLEMDHHPSMINEAASSFPSANSSATYNLAEIWHFPLSGGGVGESSGVMGPRAAHFCGSSGGFGEARTGNRDLLVEESTVTEQSGRSGAGTRKRRDVTVSEDESSKLVSSSSGNEMNDGDVKRFKVSESREENGDSKPEVGNKQTEQTTQQLAEPPKQDYIHVRARRGQATDSHSLAERARREKISERMKILQDLVPGCNKVIGKAMVLDEIINYIQSLQRQVEFLSMKLEAVNSRINPSIEGFPSKDFGAQTYDNTSMAFSSQVAREYGQGSPQEWLHMQVGGSFERAP